jgi:hypothetical protein
MRNRLSGLLACSLLLAAFGGLVLAGGKGTRSGPVR